jgi:NAD(P)-dependent dehydrogenase (short-subunit alcohol dehydrogenase family)
MAQLNLTILTGASRGMGLAMAQQLLTPQARLLCISRKTNDALALDAQRCGAQCTQWAMDLADGVSAAAALRTWLGEMDPATLAGATLINNAGVIATPQPLRDGNPAEIANALRVGLEAPMLLSTAFLGATRAWKMPRKLLNISSGLGRYAMASQSAYCAAKAGIDHFTRCIALDEAREPNGAKVCSLAPGVIATDMQVQLRSANAQAFPDLARFAGMYQQGQLASPADAARAVLQYLNRIDFGQNPVADVRD